MNSITKFIKSSFIFFIGNLLCRAISFFLLPIYTKYIPTAEYGYYDLSITYLTIITSILFCDIWSSVMRFMLEKKETDYKYKSILSGFLIFLASTSVYIIIGILLSIFVHIDYLFLIMLYGLTLNLQNMYSFIARGFGKNADFAISGIINTLLMSIGSIIMIVACKMDFSALYIAGIIGNIAQVLYLEYKVKLLKNIKWKYFEKTLLKQMVKYTLPLCINSVSFWLLTSFNRVIISHVMTIADNGIYAVGNKFAVLITLVTTCFTLAWQEMSFARKIDDENNGKFYSKACNLYIKFLGIGVTLLIPVVLLIFPILVDASYEDAKNILPLFLVATTVNAFSNFIGNIFYAIKDTKNIFISSVISSILNVILCYPLVKILGLNGATLSMLISFTVNILIRYKILNKKIHLVIDWKTILGLCFLISLSSLLYATENILVNTIWIIVLCVITYIIFKNLIQTLYKMLKTKKGEKV